MFNNIPIDFRLFIMLASDASHGGDKITLHAAQKSATHAASGDQFSFMFCLAGTVDDDER